MAAAVVFDKHHLRIAVAAQRRNGGLRRIKKPPKILVPKRFEAEYFVRLKKIFVDLDRKIQTRILGALPQIMRSADHELRRDSFDDEIQAAIDGLKLEITRTVPQETAAVARDIGEKTERQQLLDHQRTFEQVLGVQPELHETWMAPLLDGFTRSNARLVTNVSTAIADKIDTTIGAGVRQGLSIDVITAQIQKISDPGEKGFAFERARLIASDQVTKFYGDVAQVRQEQIGVTRYRWRTSEDEKVRDAHRERNGLIFTWDDIVPQLEAYGLEVPTIAGHPGREIRCRCYAEPILEDLLDAEEPTTPNDEAGGPQEGDTEPVPVETAQEVPEVVVDPQPGFAGEANREATPEALEKAQEIFGRPLLPDEMATLIGAPQGSNITATVDENILVISSITTHPPIEKTIDGRDVRIVFAASDASQSGSSDGKGGLGPRAFVVDATAAVDSHPLALIEFGDKGQIIRHIGEGTAFHSELVKTTESIPAIYLQLDRHVSKEADQILIHNDFFLSEPSGRGIGIDIFSKQVEEAKSRGVAQIDTLAARQEARPGRVAMNGYYTWPRFGYDAELSKMDFSSSYLNYARGLDPGAPGLLDRAAFKRERLRFIEEEFGAKTLLDLMDSPAGREWWKRNGETVECVFDLTPGSKSLETLADYAAERKAKGK